MLRSVIGHAEFAIEDIELERQHNLPPDHPVMQETKKQLEQDLVEQKGKMSKQQAARADLQARKQKRQGGRQLGSTVAASCTQCSLLDENMMKSRAHRCYRCPANDLLVTARADDAQSKLSMQTALEKEMKQRLAERDGTARAQSMMAQGCGSPRQAIPAGWTLTRSDSPFRSRPLVLHRAACNRRGA
jgi:hypothetical protein